MDSETRSAHRESLSREVRPHLRFLCGLVRKALLLFAAFFVLISPLQAHDIPADATVRLFVKPEGGHLRLVVRMQMVSIQEIDWPVRKEDGTLDMATLEPFLRQAANKWLGDKIDFYEEDTKIESHALAAARLSLEGDASFGTYDDAVAHITAAPLPSNTKLLPTQGVLDALYE